MPLPPARQGQVFGRVGKPLPTSFECGIDLDSIALWLGHFSGVPGPRESIRTTQIYLHAYMALKERALARTTPPGTTPGRYKPQDSLLDFLEAL